MILTSDLTALPIEQVFAKGGLVAEAGEMLADCPHFDWPKHARETVKMGKQLNGSDFDANAPENASTVRVRVIGMVENQAPTKALEAELDVIDGRIQTDEANDVARIALVERHRRTGQVENAFVSGF